MSQPVPTTLLPRHLTLRGWYVQNLRSALEDLERIERQCRKLLDEYVRMTRAPLDERALGVAQKACERVQGERDVVFRLVAECSRALLEQLIEVLEEPRRA